ncbi:MAG: malate dehydrogenase [Spirochaetota bacterium]
MQGQKVRSFVISVIGSGNVGANTAFFVAETGAADVLLCDLREGLSAGKALDLMEAAPIRTYRTLVRGTDSVEDIAGSQAVVIAAGRVRTPGMSRLDLLEDNAPLIEELAHRVAALAPEAVVILATEPVDVLTALFVRRSRLPRERVLGVGSILDATRLRYAVARDLHVSPESVAATVIGRHDERMLCLPRYTTVSGVPVLDLMGEDRFEALAREVAAAGDFIVDMARRSSAYYAPSAAIAELVRTMAGGSRRVFAVSLFLEGELGVHGAALGVPAVIGRHGVERVLVPRLTPGQQRMLRDSVGELKKLLEGRSP